MQFQWSASAEPDGNQISQQFWYEFSNQLAEAIHLFHWRNEEWFPESKK